MNTEEIQSRIKDFVDYLQDHEIAMLLTIGLLTFIVSYALVYIVKVLLISRLEKFSKNTESKLDDLVVKITKSFGWPLYIAIAAMVSTSLVAVNQTILEIIDVVSLVIVSIYIVIALQEVINYFVVRMVQKNAGSDTKQDPAIIQFMGTVGKIILWVLAIIFLIQNLGYDVTALVGGLGVAGIAVAFALQNVLGDLFSFISIYFDRPFQVGDFVVLQNGNMGTVEKVGIKSTRIRTLSGEELVVANTELTSAQLRNYSDLERRRVLMNIGVVYGTPLKKLQKVNEIVEKAVGSQELADFGRSHFHEFGDFSLNFEVVFHVNCKEYKAYMDVLQEINFEIVKGFEKEKIDMAFPTQTIHLEKN
ncbi:MAG: mechanosensitive ion channel family protein [Candidatus Dojkabacteria bacterium]